MTVLADPRPLADEAIAAALMPPPPLDYLRFAEDNIVFGDGEPVPGPYNRAAFPYFDEILRALSPSDPARYVTLVASAQIGKTVLGNIFALGSVTMGRGTTLVCHPTIDNALRWSKLKLQPMMRSTPAVQEHFPQRSRDTSDSLLFKGRADGLASLLITGANSPASLSQITVNFHEKARAEAAASSGRYVEADGARQEMGKIAGRLLASFEGGLPELASALAGHFQLPQGSG